MTFGAETWGPMLIQAAASAAGGFFGGRGGRQRESKMDKTKRKLVDQLLQSLTGEGPYSDLYKFDQDTFNKSFVEPAMAKFRNVTAPNIQQQYIAYGQQRGTGLDDTLTRAGVDLDQLLNQEMMKYQEQAQNRKAGTINQILGMSSGAQQNPSDAQNAATGVGNYISGQGFSDSVAELFRKYQQGNNASTNNNNAYRSPSGMTQGAAKGYWAS